MERLERKKKKLKLKRKKREGKRKRKEIGLRSGLADGGLRF